MKLKVCIAGATGWVGKPLSEAVTKMEDMDLVGAVSPSQKGRRLGDLIDNPSLQLTISSSVNEALEAPTDVLVDYTRTDVVKANVMTAVERGVHVVIGSSGLTNQDFADIGRLASVKKVGVIATIGKKESCGLTVNGIQIHSIRFPGYIIGVEVVFGSKDERLSIRQDAGRVAGPYIQGQSWQSVKSAVMSDSSAVWLESWIDPTEHR